MLTTILLQASGNVTMQTVSLILIVLVFYFFMIRPQLKKAKDEKKFRSALQKGDRVITIGGLHAKISEIQDTTFIIEVENGVKLKIEKSAVSMQGATLGTTEKK